MTININELRQNITTYGLEATCTDDLIGLLDRLEAAEKELVEIRHGAAVANDTIKALQAKIEQMEQQKPVEWQSRTRPVWNDGMWTQWSKCREGCAKDIMKASLVNGWIYEARPLYALPGAQGEEK